MSARDRGLKIKAVGSGHAANDSALTNGVHVSLRRLKRVLEVDRTRHTVRVQAGITLKELNRDLAKHGLALLSFGDIDQQTLGGAVATGTHGTGGAFGTLASQVVGATVVLADGSIHAYSDEDGELDGMALSIGALGVVVDLTLQCRPAFWLQQYAGETTLDALESELEEQIAAHPYFDILYDYVEDRVYTRTRDEVSAELPKSRSATRALFDDYLIQGLYGAACSMRPDDPPGLERLLKRLPRNSRVEMVDDSPSVMSAPQFVRLVSSEHAVPRELTVPALREFGSMARKRDWYSGHPLQIRFTGPDTRWLSPGEGRPTAWINSICLSPLPWGTFLQGAHMVFTEFDARPHWGKWHAFRAEELRDRYPRWDDFAELRRQVDPDGAFQNEYLGRVLDPL